MTTTWPHRFQSCQWLLNKLPFAFCDRRGSLNNRKREVLKEKTSGAKDAVVSKSCLKVLLLWVLEAPPRPPAPIWPGPLWWRWRSQCIWTPTKCLFSAHVPQSLAPVVEVDPLPGGQVVHQRAWAPQKTPQVRLKETPPVWGRIIISWIIEID